MSIFATNKDVEEAFDNVSSDMKVVKRNLDGQNAINKAQSVVNKVVTNELFLEEPTVLTRLETIEKHLGIHYEVIPERVLPAEVKVTIKKPVAKKAPAKKAVKK